MERIKRYPQQPVLIVAEGVFVYLSETQIKTLFQEIGDRFQAVEMIGVHKFCSSSLI
jgi:O-methyltransferase involved in polyketide biosynthesis